MKKIRKRAIAISVYTLLLGIIFPQSGVAQNSNKIILSLDDLFLLADSCSKQIKSAEAAFRVAEAGVKVSKNALLPEINLSASATYNGNAWVADRNFGNSNWYSSPHFGNSFSLEISQVLFAGGAIKNNIKAANIVSNMANLDIQTERQKVRFLLTGYYLDLCKSRNLLTVYQKNIEQTRQVIADMKAREAAGIALNNDITRHEVQLQNLLYKQTEIQSLIDIYNSHLVVTLELPQNTEIVPDSTLLNFSAHQYSEEEFQNMAAENSPSLEKSLLNINLNRHRQKITKAALLPKINLIAADNLKGPITYEIPTINNNINTWYVGIGLNYNIGNIYKSPKEIKRSKHSVRQAEEEYSATQEQVILDVHKAYTQYKNAFELLRTQEKSLQLATENYDVTFNRYMNDLVLIIDLLDADALKLSAEIEYTNAQINILYNYYKLLYVIGTI